MCSHWPREICPLINLYGFLAGLFLYSRMKTAPAYFHGHKKRRIVFYPGGSHADNNFTPHNRLALEKSFVWKLLEERKWKEKEAKKKKTKRNIDGLFGSREYSMREKLIRIARNLDATDVTVSNNNGNKASCLTLVQKTTQAHQNYSNTLWIHLLWILRYVCYAKHFSKFHQYYFIYYYLWDSTIIIVLEKFVTEV